MANVEIEIPNIAREDPVEDINSADLDIAALKKKFIDPIDAKRSSSIPNKNKSQRLVTNASGISVTEFISLQLQDVGFDTFNFVESRAHAFYRLIGLPVMDDAGNIFNPGFDPDLEVKQIELNQKIVSSVPNSLLAIMDKREQDALNKRLTFERASTNSTVLSLVLPIIKPFNVMKEGLTPLDPDEQSFNIASRKTFLAAAYKKRDGTNIDKFFTDGRHILKPFITDPRIVFTVLPDSNQICAPFLRDINSTRLDCQRTLDRPMIEEICRLRLKQVRDNEVLKKSVESSLDQTITALDRIDLEQEIPEEAITALLGTLEINQEDFVKELEGLTTIELLQIDKNIKVIKASIEQLIFAISEINKISKIINWFPSPNRRGPEFGSTVSNDVIKYADEQLNSPLDVQILELSLLQTQSAQSREESSEEIGSFALPYLENASKKQETFNRELNRLNSLKNRLVRKASTQLANIEIITGEISGLGLIDILAIYTALWAIPIEALISLLDDNAFNRLFVYNPQLRTAEVQARRNLGESTIPADDALQQLEIKIINILKFADYLFANAQERKFEGGEVS